METQTHAYDVLKPDGKRLARVGSASPTRKGTGLRLTVQPGGPGGPSYTYYLMPARAKVEADAEPDADPFNDPGFPFK